jgi:hypothetical protein
MSVPTVPSDAADMPAHARRRLAKVLRGAIEVASAGDLPTPYSRPQLVAIRAELDALAERVHGPGFLTPGEGMARVVDAAVRYPAVLELCRSMAAEDRADRAVARGVAELLAATGAKIAEQGAEILGAPEVSALRSALADQHDVAAEVAAWRDRQPPSKKARHFVLDQWHEVWLAAGGAPGNGKECRRFLAACADGVVPPTELSEDILVEFLQEHVPRRLVLRRDGEVVIIEPENGADDS